MLLIITRKKKKSCWKWHGQQVHVHFPSSNGTARKKFPKRNPQQNFVGEEIMPKRNTNTTLAKHKKSIPWECHGMSYKKGIILRFHSYFLFGMKLGAPDSIRKGLDSYRDYVIFIQLLIMGSHRIHSCGPCGEFVLPLPAGPVPLHRVSHAQAGSVAATPTVKRGVWISRWAINGVTFGEPVNGQT